MASRFGTAPILPSMLRLSAPFLGTADRTPAQRPCQALPCAQLPGASRQTYPALDPGRRCRLVVFGLEVGGRWNAEAASFFRRLARAGAT